MCWMPADCFTLERKDPVARRGTGDLVSPACQRWNDLMACMRRLFHGRALIAEDAPIGGFRANS